VDQEIGKERFAVGDCHGQQASYPAYGERNAADVWTRERARLDRVQMGHFQFTMGVEHIGFEPMTPLPARHIRRV
jgi:hypothetical protein